MNNLDVQTIGYGVGTLAALVPAVVPLPVDLFIIFPYMAISLFSSAMLYKKLDDKYKKYLLFLPFFFVFAGLIRSERPRVGIVMLMVAAFLVGVLVLNDLLKKNKIFTKQWEENVIQAQILLLILVSLKFFNDVIPLTDMKRSVLTR